jgi:hypothetical protein
VKRIAQFFRAIGDLFDPPAIPSHAVCRCGYCEYLRNGPTAAPSRARALTADIREVPPGVHSKLAPDFADRARREQEADIANVVPALLVPHRPPRLRAVKP